MFRKLLISLVLMVAPAFAQEYTYTIQTPVVDQNYTVVESQTTSLQNIQETGTSIPLYDDGVTTVELGFDFYFYGNVYDSINISQNGFISFTSLASGCCSGYELPYFTELNEFNESYFQWINVHNSIFAMWSDLADFSLGNPYYRGVNDSFTVGWYGVEELGSGGWECNQQGCFPVGSPNTFNFEITLYSNNNFSISYGDFNFNNQTWRTFTSGIQGDQEGESYQIYHGNDPTYLENKTFLFVSNEITITPVVPEEPEQPEEPNQNCVVNPTNPNCVINAVVEPVPDTNEPMIADNTQEAQTEQPEQPVVAATQETAVEEKPLEELLADNNQQQLAAEEKIALMADEQKSASLEDAIDKNVLEAVLSVALDAALATTTVEATTEQSFSTRRETLSASSVESAATDSSSSSVSMDMQREEQFGETESLAALDILETGRQLGQEALLVTLAGTELSALESLSEAESIAIASSTESAIESAESIGEINNNSIFISQNIIEIDQAEEILQEQLVAEMIAIENSPSQLDDVQQIVEPQSIDIVLSEEILVAENSEVQTNEDSAVETIAETSESIETFVAETIEEVELAQFEEVMVADVDPPQQNQEASIDIQIEEVMVVDATTETTIESTETQQLAEVQTEQQSAIDFTTFEQAVEMFANNIDSINEEQNELENFILQQSIAQSQLSDDDNRMSFAEAEAVTIASDPALANAFNLQPNTASLELLGVLGSRAEEKSDAELRAEQVVAANKEEQDAINANYMEADQSGILAAIGSDTDVTAYRSAMLNDNNIWYRPEDIYKNIVIRDNVRGMYFLEKGSTDTYKQMVEEQYRDE